MSAHLNTDLQVGSKGSASVLPRLSLSVFLLVFPCLLLELPTAQAQQEFSRVEIGGQFSAIGLLNRNGSVGIWPGFGGRLDFNMTPRLALETQIDYFPPSAPVRFLEQGGATLQLATGLRGKVLQSKHFAVFGLIRPGFMHFTDTSQLTGPPGTVPGTKTGPATYFALNLGGGVEFYPVLRWTARFELTGNPFLIPNSRPSTISMPPAPPIPTPGIVNDRYRFSVGVGYRLGAFNENGEEETLSGKYAFGAQFSTLIIQRRTALDAVRNEPGFGGFASYRLLRFLYADSSVVFYPRGSKGLGFQDGGRIFQGLFGIKGGITRNRISIFGKVRPGLMLSTDTVTGFTATPGSPTTIIAGPFSTFVLDLGGIVEIYATRRTFIRFDVGDTHLYFPDKTVTLPNGKPTTISGGSYQHTMQYSVGYGWRF
jgi:hypothetical protein